MKRLGFALILLISFLLAGCANSDAANPDAVLEKDWAAIEKEGKGQEVHLFMWGGDEGINRYIDQVVAPALQENYSITLERHPMDTADFIAKLQTEKQANKMDGTMDIIWINGENFKKAKENELLLGDFASKLPNLQQYIGEDKPYVTNDMGTAIDGQEAPWGKVQYVFNYNAAKVKQPPKSIKGLTKWVQENPGRFTYPNVNDFTGNAFVRHVLYKAAAKPEQLAHGYDQAWINENKAAVWRILNEMKPYLWREGKTYPDSLAQLDKMFAKGEVDFTMGFNEKRVQSLIEEGTFPSTTKTIVLDPGSIGNTHYLSIPFNSPHPAAAMLAINYMLSPDAQIQKMQPEMWGEGSVLDPTKLSEKQRRQMEEIWGQSAVPNDSILSDLDTGYTNWIKENWEDEVVKE